MPSAPADHIHLAAKGRPKLHRHMAQSTQAHNANALASDVEAVILERRIRGDACSQQRGDTGQLQVAGDGVGVAADKRERKGMRDRGRGGKEGDREG